MPSPFESAVLNLRLFDLQREPVLREARDWFLVLGAPDAEAILARRREAMRAAAKS